MNRSELMDLQRRLARRSAMASGEADLKELLDQAHHAINLYILLIDAQQQLVAQLHQAGVRWAPDD